MAKVARASAAMPCVRARWLITESACFTSANLVC